MYQITCAERKDRNNNLILIHHIFFFFFEIKFKIIQSFRVITKYFHFPKFRIPGNAYNKA